VNRGEPLQERPLGESEVTAGFQVVGKTPGLVERPGLESGDELDLVDETVLEGQKAEQEIAIGGGFHGNAPGDGVIPRRSDHGDNARSPGKRRQRRIITCPRGPSIRVGNRAVRQCRSTATRWRRIDACPVEFRQGPLAREGDWYILIKPLSGVALETVAGIKHKTPEE
jgi:hypothetical protein